MAFRSCLLPIMVLFLLSLLNSSVDAFVPHGVKGVRKHSKSSPLYAVAKAKKTKKSKVKKAKKVAKAESKAVSTDVVVRRKKDVIAMVVERTGLTKAVCEQSFEAIMATIAEEVTEGNKVQIAGFGSFKRADRKERKGFNPKTKEPITIAAKKAPSFSASKAFKEQVNGE